MELSSYFAASNSFDGFYNDFNRIFSENRVDLRIIIEGGPGTGKSSLMKKIKACYENKFKIESVYCSSDTNSLDGLIIFGEKRTVALLDGTPPHRYNVKIPGCTDIVLNLLEALDVARLFGYKEKIIKLNEEKSASYKAAYSNLYNAGIIFKAARKRAYDLLSASKNQSFPEITESKKQNYNPSRALLHSFSKTGFKLIEQLHDRELDFDYGLYQCALCSAFLEINEKYFDQLLIDPLYPTGYIAGFIEERAVSPRSVTDQIENCNEQRICSLNESNLFNEYLTLAKECLSDASKIHFELEKFYGDSMNFDKFDKIIDRCKELIEF